MSPVGFSKMAEGRICILRSIIEDAMPARSIRMQTAFLLCLAVCDLAVAGEPPAIQRLFPPGGQRGTSFEVKLTGKVGDGDLKLVSEADSIAFVLGEKRDTATITIAPTARAGVHWVRFCNASGTTELLPFLAGLVPEAAEVEPNNKIADAQQVTLPSVTINGVLEKSRDVDTYAVELRGGQTLVATMLANAILGSPMDAVLQLSNERGTVVAQNNDDIDLDPRLIFTAPADGKWFIRAFAFPSAPNSTIQFAGGADYVYRLTLSTEPVVEYTSPVVKFGEAEETRLELHGWNVSGTTASLGKDATILDTGIALPVTVETSNVPVLLESQLSPEKLLTLPVAVSGLISSEVTDTYLLNAVKSQQITLSVRARIYGSQLDPVLTVTDKDGKLIKEADDINGTNADAELQLTIPADGQYRVNVRDRYEHTSERFFYVLRCEETRPAFAVTVQSTSFTMPADKPLDIPVSIERKNGFVEPVDFRIEGLPEGITAECPRSEKDGDSSKAVKLKLTGIAKQTFQGAIRIVAESVDSKQQQFGTFTTADRKIVGELWLTAIAPEPPAPATEAAPAEVAPPESPKP